MTIKELIEQLSEEDPDRMIRVVHIIFEDRDRFFANARRVIQSTQVIEKTKLKEIK
jgi:hypothetical protein